MPGSTSLSFPSSALGAPWPGCWGPIPSWPLRLISFPSVWFPVTYQVGRITKLAVAAFVCAAAAGSIETGSHILNLVAKTAIVLTYPALLVPLRFYGEDEKRKLRELWNRVTRKQAGNAMMNRSCILLVLALGLLLIPVGLAAQPEPAVPSNDALAWNVGESIGEWTLRSIQRHPEFIRLTFDPDPAVTVEITYRRQTDCPLSTRLYCVQPAPGSAPSIALLTAVTNHIRKLEETKGDALPALKKISQPKRSLTSVLVSKTHLIALLALALVFLAVVAIRRSRAADSLSLGAIVGSLRSRWRFSLSSPPPSCSICPLSWAQRVTVMHEGNTEQNIKHLVR